MDERVLKIHKAADYISEKIKNFNKIVAIVDLL